MKKLLIILVICSSCAKTLHEPKVINRAEVIQQEKEKQDDKKRRNIGLKLSLVAFLAIFFTAQELREE